MVGVRVSELVFPDIIQDLRLAVCEVRCFLREGLLEVVQVVQGLGGACGEGGEGGSGGGYRG